MVKVDAETGKQIPLPCSFKLKTQTAISSPIRSIIPEEEIVDTWTTNERGELTFPMLLGEGDYFFEGGRGS